MRALVLDTETTGLIPNHLLALDEQPEVIEFCGLLADLKKGKIIERLDMIIRPRKFPMSEQTIKETKTKLDNELLRDKPTFDVVAPKIKKMIEAAPCIIAHNCSFDHEMISIEYERLGQSIKWPRLLCTVEQTIHLKGKRLNLTNLHIHLFDRPFPEAHRAGPDTEALLRCCIELFKRGMLE